MTPPTPASSPADTSGVLDDPRTDSLIAKLRREDVSSDDIASALAVSDDELIRRAAPPPPPAPPPPAIVAPAFVRRIADEVIARYRASASETPTTSGPASAPGS